MLDLRGPMRLPEADAARAMWHLLVQGGWGELAGAFPTPPERAAAPEAWAYVTVAFASLHSSVGEDGGCIAAYAHGEQAHPSVRVSARSLVTRSTGAGYANEPGRCRQTCAVSGYRVPSPAARTSG